MKKIIIFSEDGFLEFLDEDDRNLEDYCSDLQQIFTKNLITTIHFTSGSLIIRPKCILKIKIEETKENAMKTKRTRQKKELEVKPEIEGSEPQKSEDMIVEE